MYRFKSGKFEGRTMEQVMLRSAPRLYPVADWARRELANKPQLHALVDEFDRLRKPLLHAQVSVRCTKSLLCATTGEAAHDMSKVVNLIEHIG
jgi:hypothetical protein